MIRDSRCDRAYWDEWISYSIERIESMVLRTQEEPGDPTYRPQYVFELAKEYWHLMFQRYSRGDPIEELAKYFDHVLHAWEEAERLGKDVWTPEQQYTRHDWKENLDHYIVCFWLVGLALTLGVPDEQWRRLLALIGNEGKDHLLDRIIASRQPSRQIGTSLCHPAPYQRLLDGIDAPKDKQPELLLAFVENWYAELNRSSKTGRSERTLMYARPYWYKYHDPMGGAYFGYWCVEAVAAVKAFGLDNSLCLGHPNYPGDLLRPNGPTTHSTHTAITDGVQDRKQPIRGGLLRFLRKK